MKDSDDINIVRPEKFAELIKEGNSPAYAMIPSLHITRLPKADEPLTVPLPYRNSFKSKQWRYPYRLKDSDDINIVRPEKFAELIKEGNSPAYAMIPSLHITRLPKADEPLTVPLPYRKQEEVFSKEKGNELPPLEGRQHAIKLEPGAKPPYSPIYNLSEKELEILQKYLRSSEAKGWIRKSKSPAGAPILFVSKKDGGLRLCVNYRALNKITIKDRYPLPLISETLDKLRDAKVFTSLDLQNAYHRVRIKRGDEWKTAFRTRYGHYEYQVMPFGLSNAPATFQAYINDALAGLVDVICVVYLDDILVYSSNPSQHEDHIRQVLERLREANLFVKLSKCSFSTQSVEFLGYVISPDGVSMEKSQIDTIKDWPEPENVKDVQVFIGFVNFYQHFIANFSAIARPLTSLMRGKKKGQLASDFQWNDAEQVTFNALKDAFTTTPFLMHFDPSKSRKLETNASNFAITEILSQPKEWPAKNGAKAVWHPIAFFSKKLEPAELNYEIHDQKLLAIIRCFMHWKHYLEGSSAPVKVLTNHNNLRHFMTTTMLSRRQARWALKLSKYDFVIIYKQGKNNPADEPSRRPDYKPAQDEINIMLPTLQNKLRSAIRNGLICVPGIADGTTESLRQVNDDTSCRLTRISQPTNGNAALGMSIEAIEATSTPDQRYMPMMLDSSQNLFGGLDNLLREAGEGLHAGQHNHEYAVPRFFIAKVMEAETATPESNSLLFLLIELQKRDALAVEKRARLQKAGDADWNIGGDKLLRHQRKAYVPNDAAVRSEIMKICHDDPTAGHFGQDKTLKLIQRKYYWPKMGNDVKEYVRTCDICQRTKARRTKAAGVMQAPSQPSKMFESITMDFITDLAPCKSTVTGKVTDSLLVIVDRYSKDVEYIPYLKTINAPELACLFIAYWFKDHGLPTSIITDRGSVFTSRFWTKVCFYLRITKGLSTAFHPQTDEQTKRQNQALEAWFRCFICYLQDDYVNLLPLAKFAYMNAYHEVIKMTPNKAKYGINLETRQGIEDNPIRGEIPTAKERAEEVVKKRQKLENSWRKTKETQAKWYNKNHHPIEFKVKQQVLLSARNIKIVRPNKKLDYQFLGPFKITEKIGKQAYRLDLPLKYSRLHNVFHVSLLEPYRQRSGESPEVIQPDLVDG